MDSAQAIWEHRPQKNKTVSTVTIICCRFGLETEASLHDAHKAWFQEEKKNCESAPGCNLSEGFVYLGQAGQRAKGEFIHLLLLFSVVAAVTSWCNLGVEACRLLFVWVKLYFLASQFEPVHHFL